MKLSLPARTFVTLVVVSGLGAVVFATQGSHGISPTRMLAFLLVACVAARLKVKLPGMTSSMAVNLPFILIAAAQMSLAEALIVGCVSNFVHCLPADRRKFSFVQTAFNVSNMAVAVAMTRALYDSGSVATLVSSHPLRLAIAAAGFFLVNTVPVAVVLTLAEARKLVRTWLEIAQLSFPYFLSSAGIAGVALTLSSNVGWQAAAAILIIMLAVFASYRRYFAAVPALLGKALLQADQSEPIRSAGVAEIRV